MMYLAGVGWILLLPLTYWWVFVPAGILLATTRHGMYFVLAGGVFADAWYGTSLPLTPLYTTLAVAVSIARIYIEDRVLV